MSTTTTGGTILCDAGRIDGLAIRDKVDLHQRTAGEHGLVSLHFAHTPEPYMYRGPDGTVYRTLVGLAGFEPTDLDGSTLPTTAEVCGREAAAREARREAEFQAMTLVDLSPRSVGFDLRETGTAVKLPRGVRQVIGTDGRGQRVYEGSRDQIAAAMRRAGYEIAE